ncbi:MAG: HEAT repeat domain-containing protein [Planctomycetes bacterium]|nr:HEAT repeat domain-containing protein [Planctomycetota bacterium]
MRFLNKLIPVLVLGVLLLAELGHAQVPLPAPAPSTGARPTSGTPARPSASGYDGPSGTGERGGYAPTGTGQPSPYEGPTGVGKTGHENDPPTGQGSTGGQTGGQTGGSGGSGGGSTPIEPPSGFGPPPASSGPGSGAATPATKPHAGETGPLGESHGDDSWQNWWLLNEGWMLDVERRYRSQSDAREISRDLFAGDIDPEAGAPIEARGATARRQTLPVFKRFLDHDHPRVRAEACIAIGRAGGEEQVAWLAPMTKDRERDVRKAAIIGLGLLRQSAGLPYLQHILRDRGAQIIERAYAALAVGMVGDKDSAEFLIDRLTTGTRVQEVDAALLYGLGLIEGDARARRYLEDYLNRGIADDVLRSVAAMGLGLQRDIESCESLLVALRDADVRVRRSAAIALGQLDYGSAYRKEWDELEASIAKDGGEVASDRVIGELESYRARLRVKLEADEKKLDGLRDKVIDALAQDALEDSDVMVRNFALIALGELGGERPLAILRGQLYDARLDSTRAFAALGMAVHGDPSAGEQVYKRLARKAMDQETRAAMMLAIGLLGENDAIEVIRRQFKAQGDVAVARASAVALGLLGDETAVKPLQQLLFSRSRPELKRAYGQALALLGDNEMIKQAGKALRERGSIASKVEIAAALAQVYDQRSLGTLLEVADPAKRKDLVLAAVVRALGILSERGERPLTAPMFRHLNYTLRFQSLNEVALI